ncbi:MAG: DivIVA domain-containing protein, partial [Candidatus Krumholzibacteria bacterium]|nr:DivIVA domain-containing protein [Candidatus Krumholzibacteria bacterium]
FKSMETNLRNTLMTAEKITAEAKENARKEADLIVRGAEVDATRSAEAIRAHTQQLRREILELKKHKDNYVTRLRTLLDSHRNVIDGFEEDFAEVDIEIEAIGKKVEKDIQTPPPASRMSRERIEEDFAHEEPEDKVTWGDDQPRKDVERPTVPRPGEWEQQNPEKRGAAPEDVQSRQDEKAEQEEETASSPQLDFGPAGVISEEDAISAATAAASRSDEEITEEELEGEALARDVVAHSIEERMYPESHIKGDAQAAPVVPQQTAPGAGAPVAQAGQAPSADMPAASQQPGIPASATAVQSEPAAPAASDDWKSYEVKESKHDWSSYEVPRQEAPAATQPAPQQTKQPAANKAPTDNEVEEALSGLTEMGSEQPKQAAPKAETPAAEAAPAQAQQPDADNAEKSEEDSEESQKWSMEELRKNLTNMDRDS